MISSRVDLGSIIKEIRTKLAEQEPDEADEEELRVAEEAVAEELRAKENAETKKFLADEFLEAEDAHAEAEAQKLREKLEESMTDFLIRITPCVTYILSQQDITDSIFIRTPLLREASRIPLTLRSMTP
jgi:DNA-binding transcriptional MerR regulator